VAGEQLPEGRVLTRPQTLEQRLILDVPRLHRLRFPLRFR
jgi:hypothetical protein